MFTALIGARGDRGSVSRSGKSIIPLFHVFPSHAALRFAPMAPVPYFRKVVGTHSSVGSERTLHTREVVGSTPTASTRKNPRHRMCRGFFPISHRQVRCGTSYYLCPLPRFPLPGFPARSCLFQLPRFGCDRCSIRRWSRSRPR